MTAIEGALVEYGKAIGLIFGEHYGKKLIDSFINSFYEHEVDPHKMFDNIQDLLDKASVSGEVYDSSPAVSRGEARYITEAESVKANIKDALSKLKNAKETTKCGYCKLSLDKAISEVEKGTKSVVDSSNMWIAIQDMKRTGDLPADAKWKDLSPIVKKEVEERAKKYV